MTKLSVNVNKVATLRNTRPQLNIPSVVHCARICLDAGAQGITVHPRPDQRHIRPRDIDELVELLKSYPGVEFNIEGNPFYDYLPIVRKVKPTQCTLVPDTPDAFTSDQGWDIPANASRLKPVVDELKSIGCRVSVFMDAKTELMEGAAALRVDRIELYTEPYAAAFARRDEEASRPYADAARAAHEAGLGVNAGHDLNLENLRPFLRDVAYVEEVSIGHALIADALEFGLAATVRKYLAACGR